MKAGRVQVNGQVVTELGVRVVVGRDLVELDGDRVELPAVRWVAFHKPPGVLTTRGDPHGGTTVFDLLPDELGGLRYVGRLDRDAEGLLLLTNHGDMANALQHPAGGVEREYRAEVNGSVEPGTVARLLYGVELEDGLAAARRVELLDSGPVSSTVRLVLTEGRKREVRRMMSAVGHPVRRLTRTRFGTVLLGDLAPGAWRPLDEDERDGLAELAMPPRPDRA